MPYDYAAEIHDARNASPYGGRRIGTAVYDENEAPTRAEAERGDA